MIDIRGIIFIMGWLLIGLGGIMCLPMLVDLAYGYLDWRAFGFAAAVTVFTGTLMVLMNQTSKITLGIRQAFVLTAFTWIILAAFAALPLHMGSLKMPPVDAYFETMSGLTTTGSSVITRLADASMGTLLWRSLIQWIGGIGIIVIAVSILPMLQVGGMQLFRTESSESSDKVLPKVGQLAQSILIAYATLSMACLLGYWLAGMSGFDALNHTMTTLATGGFSTQDASLGAYDHLPMVKVNAIVFMLAGALPFVLYIRAMQGGTKVLFSDTQVQTFLLIIGIFVALVFVQEGLETPLALWLPKLVDITFVFVSIITTTGYTGVDYMTWSALGIILVFFTLFIGGCAGSTSGGIKVFRLQIIASLGNKQVSRLLQPHGIFIAYFNGKPIASTVMESVTGFLFFYALFFVALTLALSAMNLDAITAMSAVASSLSNVGPAIGSVVGPTTTFAALPDAAKWLLSFAMLLGRLEFFTILVLLTPTFWKN